jgi:menaquinone-9 beta-reductase
VFDVAVIGGGPAGLAAALEARARGLRCVVVERQQGPVDKACGEGLMPAGLAILQRLGVTQHLDAHEWATFETITYLQNNGRVRAEGRLPAPGGLGVRRLALSAAMRARATEVGVELREGTSVRQHHIDGAQAHLELSTGDTLTASMLVAADGLHSPTRARAGLAGDGPPPLARYGLRQHFECAPWAKTVEVHFAPGIEAYVTPAGRHRVGVAFLWAHGEQEKPSVERLLALFPVLAERLAGAPTASEPRGAGPLLQRAVRRTAPRLALVGDAAGYVDAITGEGLTLAFQATQALGAVLPHACTEGTVEALAPYERAAARQFASYSRLASALVWVAQRPALRSAVIRSLSVAPLLLTAALHLALPKPHPVR